jgi:uncharacterized membrane protein
MFVASAMVCVFDPKAPAGGARQTGIPAAICSARANPSRRGRICGNDSLDHGRWQQGVCVVAPQQQPGAIDAPVHHRAALHEAERRLLDELRTWRRRLRQGTDLGLPEPRLTLGQHIADAVAATMGSWRFIIIQSAILLVWIILNVTAYVQNWDPYPFILLNLALSFQAAYAAPFIMMSQNRQQDIDRQAAENDYRVNIKAELEIELLHEKIDQLRQTEVTSLAQAVRDLTELLRGQGLASPPTAPDRV